MEVPFRKLNYSDVENANWSRKEQVDATTARALQYLSDPECDKRWASVQCVVCYYGTRIGGAAMTKSYCGHCQMGMVFNSTSTDKLCPACAVQLDLCKHCGAGIDLKLKRTLVGKLK